MDLIRVGLVASSQEEREGLATAFDHAPISWDVSFLEDIDGDTDVVVGCSASDGIDIVFDPSNIEAMFSQVALLAARPTTLIVVTSACGGVGVTTIAVHLARSIAARAEVCYVDIDPEGGGAARLGMPSDVCRFHPDEELRTVPHEGFRCVFASRTPSAAVTAAVELFPVVIVDAPRCAWSEVADLAATSIVVTPPTIPGVVRTKVLLERIPSPRIVVSNRIGPGGDRTDKELARELGCSFDLRLATCARLRDAEDAADLVCGFTSRWARSLERLAVAVS